MRNNKLLSLYYHTNSIYNRIFSFAKRLVTSNPADTLLNGLIWYYKLDEATGTRIDASVSGLDLTENGTVGQGTGVIGDAASFPGINSNNLDHVNDSIYSLTADFTITGWINFDTLAATQTLVYIGNGGGGSSTNVVNFRYDLATDCIRGSLSNGTSNTNIDQQISNSIPTGQFVFIALRYDSVNGKAFLRLNNQPDTIVSFFGPLNNPGNQSFSIGALLNGSNPVDGLMDEVLGANRFYTNTEINFIYNNGLGNRPNFEVLMTDPDGNTLTDPDGVELNFLGG